MPDIIMETARDIGDDNAVELVQLPGTPHRPGHLSFDPRYHRNLHCPHCSAKVHFRAASKRRAGSFKGPSAHFHTNPGQKHEDCPLPERDHGNGKTKVDKSKGYRIHINTLSHSVTFNRYSGVYRLGGHGELEIDDPDFKDMETVSIKSAEDLVDLMSKGEFKRVNDSIVIFDNSAIAWKEFMAFLQKPERYAAILRHLQFGQRATLGRPVLIEMETAKVISGDLFSKSTLVNGKSVLISKSASGFREYVVPGIKLVHNNNTIMGDLFNRAGKYLILGIPQLNTKDGAGHRTHFFNITVNDAQQVHFGGMDDVIKLAKTKAGNRATRAAAHAAETAAPSP